MNIYPFKATTPKMDRIDDVTGFFKSVKEVYPSLRELGFFEEDTEQALYAYKISQGKNSMIGLLCSASLQDFEDNLIKKHEQTLLKKELLMLRLLEERSAMIKPVLVAYQSKNSIEKELLKITQGSKADHKIDFKEDQERHSLWKISSSKKIKKLQALFKSKVDTSYIADGHHRSTTTKMIYEGDSIIKSDIDPPAILTAYFSFSQLKIYDYNRVISLPPDLNLPTFLKQLGSYGTIINGSSKALKKYHFQLYHSGQWHRFKWNKDIIAHYKKEKGTLLDVHLFNAIIVQKILGINNVRETDYLEYMEGTKGKKGIKKLVGDTENKIGFKLCPVKRKDLIAIAEADQYMPPKSTYFEPRIKNGVIVQKF